MILCNAMINPALNIDTVSSLFSMSQVCIYSDPALQAELFNDIAHVGLDIVALMSPAQPVLRLSILVGRIFAFLSDYVPDHAMYPEEWVFQVITILFSATLFVQSCRPLLPLVKSNPLSLPSNGSNKTSFRDLRAYQVLFRKFDMSWLQFKVLTAEVVEWVEVEPNAQVRPNSNGVSRRSDGEEFMYWLQRGEIFVYYINGTSVQHIDSCRVPPEARLVSELGFSRHLLRKASGTGRSVQWSLDAEIRRRLHKESEEIEIDRTREEECEIGAGPLGATLLRMNTSRLLELMEYDEQLEVSIRGMVATGMQEKLCAILEGPLDKPNENSDIPSTIDKLDVFRRDNGSDPEWFI